MDKFNQKYDQNSSQICQFYSKQCLIDIVGPILLSDFELDVAIQFWMANQSPKVTLDNHQHSFLDATSPWNRIYNQFIVLLLKIIFCHNF